MTRRAEHGTAPRGRRGPLVCLLALIVLPWPALGCGSTPQDAASGPVSPPQPSVAESAEPDRTAVMRTPTPKASASFNVKPSLIQPREQDPVPRGSASGARGKKATLVFVDVGQGDAILLKSGVAAVLVDAGPSAGARAVETAMRRSGITDLDHVVATHMHADHIGGLVPLVRRHRPTRAFIAGVCDPRLRAAFKSARTRVVQVRRGTSLRFGSVKAEVLSPGGISGDKNADSVVLLLDVNGRRILLTGDLTGPNEATVGSITARGPPLYVLKVAHHGSAYSTDTAFLTQTRPEFAVIEVGRNSYGHPSPAAVTRLRRSGARVYTTQRNGTMTLTIDPGGAAKWRFTKSSKPLLKVADGAASGSRALAPVGGGTTTGDPSATGRAGDVYITRTGACYHRGGCRHLSHSRVPISLAQAKARGYRPCKVCRPPR